MTARTTDPHRTLFVLAGYRASGKTFALRAANKRDDFALFPAALMPDFKRIVKSKDAPRSNSGFYSLKGLDAQHLRQNPVVGVHYDLLLPPQKLINDELVQRYAKSGWKKRTPAMVTDLLRQTIANGSLRDCIDQQVRDILEIGSAFDQVAFSFIQSDCKTNRQDWLARTLRKTGCTLDELRSAPKYSFNLSVFHDDPALGQTLYQFVHQTWFDKLNQYGCHYTIVERSGSSYAFRDIAPQ